LQAVWRRPRADALAGAANAASTSSSTAVGAAVMRGMMVGVLEMEFGLSLAFVVGRERGGGV
jgi:hypothetical protein